MIEPRLVTLGDLFADRSHYQVPIYQRPYVWDREEQWVPLWEDLRETTKVHLEGGDAPHFLGAIVIELISAQPGRVKEYAVIDGQQRLTTLQLMLAALGAVAAEAGSGQAEEIQKLLVNDGKHAVGDLRLKVAPGQHDFPAFVSVVSPDGAGPAAGTEGVLGAFAYFKGAIAEWVGEGADPEQRAARLDGLQEALEGLLQVVSIQLDDSADAQVIFETLNSRGADLTSLDLAKNALFRMAEREKADVMRLHEEHWQPALGDADYWLAAVRQGRYTSERADLFLNHWLTMKTGKPARVGHLFADFRKSFLAPDTGPSATELIVELSADAATFRSFDDFDPTSAEGRFFHRLDLMDTTTLLPVALLLFRSDEFDEERRRRALHALESWLVRRMLLGATTAHYNRLLAFLLGTLNEQSSMANADEVIVAVLRGYSNPTDTWPQDDEVILQLETRPLYRWINQGRIRLLLEACELRLADSNKTEQLPLPDKLSIEHALPQNWVAHWPLPAERDDEAGVEEREARVNRLGNLTLVTSGLNSSLSDSEWSVKRKELALRSQLLVNQQLCVHEEWNEEMIDARGAALAKLVVLTWPGPDAAHWEL